MSNGKNKTADLMSGGVLRTLVTFATPMFLANLCQTAYNIINMVIIGWYVGSEGLSGVSIGADLTYFLLFLATGLTSAGQVILSRHLGANDARSAEAFTGTFLSFTLICGFGVAVVSFLACPLALTLMNTPAEAYDSARIYTVIGICGMPFVYSFNAVSAVFRSHGDSRRPLYFTLTASLVNIFLGLLFVAACGLGVFGAAFATFIGQAVSFVCAFVCFWRNRKAYGFALSRASLRMERAHLCALVKLGVPMALQHASVSFSKLFVNSWINSYGLAVSAATGVAARINQVGSLYSTSIAAGAAIMISHSIGAGAIERVKKVVRVSFGVAAVPSVALALGVSVFPLVAFQVFTADSDVLAVAQEYAPLLVLDFLIVAPRCAMNGFINGCGKGSLNLAIAILDGPVFRIGLGLLLGLALNLGYFGFWLGSTLAGLTPAVVGGSRYVKGQWLKPSAQKSSPSASATPVSSGDRA